MNANDRGLVFFIGAIVLIWLILDDFYGKKYISKFVDNIAGDADEAIKDAIIDNVPGAGAIVDTIENVKDAVNAPPATIPDITKPESMIPVPGKDGGTAGNVKPGDYHTSTDYYNKPFMPPPWSGYGPRPGQSFPNAK